MGKSRLLSAAVWAEGRLLPLLFLFLAAHTAWGLTQPLPEPGLAGARTPLESTLELLRQLAQPDERTPGATPFLLLLALLHGFVRPALLVGFNLACAGLIAFRSHLRYRPTSLREVGIPLAGTFCMAALPLSLYLPDWLTARPSFPAAGAQILLFAGIGLTLAGQLLALYAIAHLRRNFAIFVEVREVVLSGPYGWVLHPLYTAEIAMAAGAVLMFPSAVGAAAVGVLIYLQQLRAEMEETALADASEAYARRLETSRRFLPPWTGDSPAPPSTRPARPLLRAGLSALALAVLAANAFAMLRGYEGAPDRASEPVRSYVYDAFMLYHLFTGYTKQNRQAQVFGHRDETGWTPIDVDHLLPFRPGHATLRLRTWHHEHLEDPTPARSFLAAKLRERFNRAHPSEPVDAVAFGVFSWPASPEGYYTHRNDPRARFQPWFAERVRE